ncbi:MAG: PhoU domain-containing protein [Candidatus Zixiibacteriota bacterium]
MYKKFLELFGKENLLDQAIEVTIKMLETDREMFVASTHSLRKHDDARLPFDIYEKDKEINKFEREVRRNVMTHLSVTGTSNIVPGLVLVSIVIDVERIGDFTKNIVELATAHPQKLLGGIFENDLVEIEKIVIERFDKIGTVIKNMDFNLARGLMSDHRNVSSRVDKFILEIINEKDKSLSPGDAVTLALYFRYLKRVAAHITNIASSIVNPFPSIGFKQKYDD